MELEDILTVIGSISTDMKLCKYPSNAHAPLQYIAFKRSHDLVI